MRSIVASICLMLLLSACGGPSEADLQATVQAAVQATARAEQVAADVAATQEAESACGEAALNEYADAIATQMAVFEQQAQLVGSTPRGSMGVSLQRLLDIQTETRAIVPPACLKEYHDRVLVMMQIQQIGYQNFAAQGDETLTQASITLAEADRAGLLRDLELIRAGTVPPTPTPLAATAVP